MKKRKSVSMIMEGCVSELSERIRRKQNENSTQLIELDESTYNIISYILSKSTRSKEDIYIVQVFLNSIPRFVNLFSQKHLDYIMLSLGLMLKHETKPKNSMIMRFGDKGNKCYIMLKGKAVVLLPKENVVHITIIDYMKVLINLKIMNEDELFIKTLNDNKALFKVNNQSFNALYQYLQGDNTKKDTLENFFTIKEIRILELYFKSLSEIDFDDINSNEYMKMIYPSFITESKDNKPTEEIIIYSYIPITTKKRGDIIGELALQQNNNKRTATIICTEDCIFGTLTRDGYNSIIKDIQWKKRKSIVNFLLSFQIFKGMNWNYFESKIFNYFKYETYEQGKEIIKQNQKGNTIYFVKQGCFEVSTYSSIQDIKSIIQSKSKLLQKSEQSEDNLIKKVIKISIINSQDVLGLSDYIYNDKFFTTVTCISSTATVYSIGLEIVDKLCDKINTFKEHLYEFIKHKEDVIVQRLYSIYQYNYKKERKIKKLEAESIHRIFSARPVIKSNGNLLNIKNTSNSLLTLRNEQQPYISIFQRDQKRTQTVLSSFRHTRTSHHTLNTSALSSFHLNNSSSKQYLQTISNERSTSRFRYTNTESLFKSKRKKNHILKLIIDNPNKHYSILNSSNNSNGISIIDFLYYDNSNAKEKKIVSNNNKSRNITTSFHLSTLCSTSDNFSKSQGRIKKTKLRLSKVPINFLPRATLVKKVIKKLYSKSKVSNTKKSCVNSK